MGIKIMMSPDVVDSVARALIAKQVLREIVRESVKTPLDEHYFAVTMHKGVSDNLQRLSFKDISKLLSCSNARVHQLVAEHTARGRARGGCKLCNGASEELKGLLVQEAGRRHGSREPLSLLVLLESSAGRRQER